MSSLRYSLVSSVCARTARSGDSTSTAGPTRTLAGAARPNVLAWQRRSASVTGFAIAVRKSASPSVKLFPAALRQRSRKPQQPYRHRNTRDATSVTPYRESISRQTRLRSGWSPVDTRRRPTGTSSRVQRLMAVRYLSRIRRGSSGRQGTSARGAEPTSVSGSVRSQAYASNLTTRRISSSTASRKESASAVVVRQTRNIRSIARGCAVIAVTERWYAGVVAGPVRSEDPNNLGWRPVECRHILEPQGQHPGERNGNTSHPASGHRPRHVDIGVQPVRRPPTQARCPGA